MKKNNIVNSKIKILNFFVNIKQKIMYAIRIYNYADDGRAKFMNYIFKIKKFRENSKSIIRNLQAVTNLKSP